MMFWNSVSTNRRRLTLYRFVYYPPVDKRPSYCNSNAGSSSRFLSHCSTKRYLPEQFSLSTDCDAQWCQTRAKSMAFLMAFLTPIPYVRHISANPRRPGCVRFEDDSTRLYCTVYCTTCYTMSNRRLSYSSLSSCTRVSKSRHIQISTTGSRSTDLSTRNSILSYVRRYPMYRQSPQRCIRECDRAGSKRPQ